MKVTAHRLTRQHLALYRGWLDGAAMEGLHSAYGEAGTDVRVTRRLIATMRDTLAVAARATPRPPICCASNPAAFPGPSCTGARTCPRSRPTASRSIRTAPTARPSCCSCTGGISRPRPRSALTARSPATPGAGSNLDQTVARRLVHVDREPFRKTDPEPRLERQFNVATDAQHRPDLRLPLLDCCR